MESEDKIHLQLINKQEVDEQVFRSYVVGDPFWSFSGDE